MTSNTKCHHKKIYKIATINGWEVYKLRHFLVLGKIIANFKYSTKMFGVIKFPQINMVIYIKISWIFESLK